MRIYILLSLFLIQGASALSQSTSIYLLGKFSPADDARFVKLTAQHASGGALSAYLRSETVEAFCEMKKAAQVDGFDLKIISATRNFERQKEIWENKWNGKTPVEGKDISTLEGAQKAKLIMRYSSMPGTSRHHWGTDIDLNSVEVNYWKTSAGQKIYEWLKVNAGKFGFCQPYTNKAENNRTGYEEEAWHWSYFPLSGKMLDDYNKQIRYADIKGFAGSEYAEAIKVISIYVNGVSCKEN